MEPPASRPAGNPGLDERVLVVFGSSNREFKTMKKLIVGRACLAALALSTTSGIRAEDYIYSGFDLDTEGWARGWGVGDFTLDWDASTDAKGDPASGSLKITVNYPSSTSWQEFNLQKALGFDFTTYSKIAYDVKVDAATSTATANGDFNITQIAMRGPGWSWNGWHTTKPVVAGQWTQVEELLPSGFSSVVALNIGFAGNDFVGPITYWLDNVRFVSDTVAPPPQVAVEAAVPGLEVVATGSQYQRQSLRTVEPRHSWTASSGAVRYSFDVAKGPGAGATDHFIYLWLIGTESGDPGGSPDWNEPNAVFLELRQAANGSYSALLSHKTDAPNAHGTRFDPAGVLARLQDIPSVLGRWTVVMKGTTATLVAPDGTEASGELPADSLGGFANVFPHLGAQMDNTVAKNRSVTFGRFRIQGDAADFQGNLDVNFAGLASIDAATWKNVAQDTSGIQLVPGGTVYKFSWDAPATGYSLRSKASLGGAWTDPGLPVVGVGGRKATYLPASQLPSADAGFFAVKK